MYQRKSNRASINFINLTKAIKAVEVGNIAVATAARIFEIPRTSLNRYIQKIEKENVDIVNIKDDKLSELLQRCVSYESLSTEKMVRL